MRTKVPSHRYSRSYLFISLVMYLYQACGEDVCGQKKNKMPQTKAMYIVIYFCDKDASVKRWDDVM